MIKGLLETAANQTIFQSLFRLQSYNIGLNIADKFTKISKIGFSVECFTAGISHFSMTTVKICLLGARLDPRFQLKVVWSFS